MVITAEVAFKVAYAVVFRELILKTIAWEATLKVISFELFCFFEMDTSRTYVSGANISVQMPFYDFSWVFEKLLSRK